MRVFRGRLPLNCLSLKHAAKYVYPLTVQRSHVRAVTGETGCTGVSPVFVYPFANRKRSVPETGDHVVHLRYKGSCTRRYWSCPFSSKGRKLFESVAGRVLVMQ